MKLALVLSLVFVLTLSVSALEAGVGEESLWDNTDCTGKPFVVARQPLNFTNTCSSDFNTNCVANATQGGSSKRRCPSEMLDTWATITTSDKYVTLTRRFTEANCVGAALYRAQYLADNTCRKVGSTYIIATCDSSKASIKFCSDASCSTCSDSSTLSGDLDTCIGGSYKMLCVSPSSGSFMAINYYVSFAALLMAFTSMF